MVGPGQLLREARYFALENEITCVDLDVSPKGVDVFAYSKMLRANEPGRVIKAVGRKLIGNDRPELEEWKKQLGRRSMPDAKCDRQYFGRRATVGHVGHRRVWSVFQSIPDRARAVRRCVEALAPGGVLYIGVQLWTCNTGDHKIRAFTRGLKAHRICALLCNTGDHNIRAFTGREEELPLFAHLRPGHEHEVEPSAWLNKLRLSEWRAIYSELGPGFTEFYHATTKTGCARR